MPAHNRKTFVNKSDPVVRNYIDDLRKNDTEHVHLARCLKRLGDGRVEVIYCEGEKATISQVIIPGRFRGRAKHSSFVDIGSFLLIAETGVTGPAALEMIALISPVQIDMIKAVTEIDNRVLATEIDKDVLASGKNLNEDGFVFDTTIQEDQKEVNIDDI
jgi:hypothetical protein